MITRLKFVEISTEIEKTISDSLDYLKKIDEKNYILFLAEGEFVEQYENTTISSNPFMIDYGIDKYRDQTRFEFLTGFLNTYYSFPESINSIDDNYFRLNLELMVYTHIWESKPFLKKLCRLAKMLNGEEYDWKLVVPNKRKHEFIIDVIRENFKSSDQKIWETIKNGFHTSLRNAFAHSEYSFTKMNNQNRINLYNYSDQDWELKSISFDDWSIRFVYSVLLSYHFYNMVHEKRQILISEFGTNTFKIKHPRKNGTVGVVEIEYHNNGNRFNFKK